MSEWRDIKKERPSEYQPIWIYCEEGVFFKIYRDRNVYSFTHWKPAEIPAPPVIKSPAEEAADRIISKSCDSSAAKNAAEFFRKQLIEAYNAGANERSK